MTTVQYNIDTKTKYKWMMLLHALGDTIGFNNGEWEFNHYIYEKRLTLDYVNEMIYEFIEQGGVNGIDLRDWHVSDDTLFNMATAKTMLKFKNDVTDKFVLVAKSEMHATLIGILDEKRHKDPLKRVDRKIGDTTLISVSKFSDNFDARNDTYDSEAGGNGVAMRSLVIGMCLYGENNRDKLIDCSMTLGMLTHNNPIGYLGGFNAALFAALAIENVALEKWPFILLDYLRSSRVKSYITPTNLDEAWDYNVYLKHWKKYVDTRFVDGKPIKNKSFANPMYRIRYYHDNFFKDTGSLQIGASGYLCMIMAYDTLLDCDGKWEKLIVYGILHSGDSDTIGAVAGGLYGALYGKGDVPKKMLKYLEHRDELIDLSEKLFDKFKQ